MAGEGEPDLIDSMAAAPPAPRQPTPENVEPIPAVDSFDEAHASEVAAEWLRERCGAFNLARVDDAYARLDADGDNSITFRELRLAFSSEVRYTCDEAVPNMTQT